MKSCKEGLGDLNYGQHLYPFNKEQGYLFQELVGEFAHEGIAVVRITVD